MHSIFTLRKDINTLTNTVSTLGAYPTKTEIENAVGLANACGDVINNIANIACDKSQVSAIRKQYDSVISRLEYEILCFIERATFVAKHNFTLNSLQMDTNTVTDGAYCAKNKVVASAITLKEHTTMTREHKLNEAGFVISVISGAFVITNKLGNVINEQKYTNRSNAIRAGLKLVDAGKTGFVAEDDNANTENADDTGATIQASKTDFGSLVTQGANPEAKVIPENAPDAPTSDEETVVSSQDTEDTANDAKNSDNESVASDSDADNSVDKDTPPTIVESNNDEAEIDDVLTDADTAMQAEIARLRWDRRRDDNKVAEALGTDAITVAELTDAPNYAEVVKATLMPTDTKAKNKFRNYINMANGRKKHNKTKKDVCVVAAFTKKLQLSDADGANVWNALTAFRNK